MMFKSGTEGAKYQLPRTQRQRSAGYNGQVDKKNPRIQFKSTDKTKSRVV
jgi:hypothetical protein